MAASAYRLVHAAADQPAPSEVRTPELAAYEALRFGVSFHFSMNTFTGKDYEPGNVPATTYKPSHLDVRQWIRVTQAAGARYAVLTAKHMSGFCLWPSKFGDYSVADSGNTTDVVAKFVAACEEYGVRPGAYYCIWDPHHGADQDSAGHLSDSYIRLVHQHVTELLTRYPKLFYLLFDITVFLTDQQRWDLYRLVKQLNPRCLVVMNQLLLESRRNRGRTVNPGAWPVDIVNSEDTLPPKPGHDPHVEVQGRQYYLPMESWMTSGPLYKFKNVPDVHAWFWRPGYVTRPASELYGFYQACLARRANLLLNLAPNTDGLLPQDTVTQMKELKQLITNTRG